MRNEPTVLLELAESGERFVEAALGGGHEALNNRQHFGEGDDAGRGSFNIHEPGFAFAPAADAPEVFGHFVNQDFFGGVGGLVVGAEIGFEAVEFGGIFAGVDEGFRVETVLEGVAAAGGFPRRSDRARTVMGIGAVGFGSRGGLGNWRGLVLAGLFERLALDRDLADASVLGIKCVKCVKCQGRRRSRRLGKYLANIVCGSCKYGLRR